MNTILERLEYQAWVTMSGRYEAARRLRMRELFATVSLAFFSATSVGIAFVQRIYVTSGSPTDDYLTALSGCLGILLLAISLMEWGMGNGAKAEALHRNAEELNAFRRKVWLAVERLKAGQALTWAEVDVVRAEYESIKAGCRFNHEPIDDKYFRASRRLDETFKKLSGQPPIGAIEKYWIYFRWYWKSLWYLGLFWLAIILALYFALPVDVRGSFWTGVGNACSWARNIF